MTQKYVVKNDPSLGPVVLLINFSGQCRAGCSQGSDDFQSNFRTFPASTCSLWIRSQAALWMWSKSHCCQQPAAVCFCTVFTWMWQGQNATCLGRCLFISRSLCLSLQWRVNFQQLIAHRAYHMHYVVHRQETSGYGRCQMQLWKEDLLKNRCMIYRRAVIKYFFRYTYSW